MTSTLTPARFAIESSTGIVVVDGYHTPGYHWNGWAVPVITDAAVDVLISRFTGRGDAQVVRDGDTVRVTEEGFEDEPYILTPETAPDGITVWHVGEAWCWTLADADDETAALTPTA